MIEHVEHINGSDDSMPVAVSPRHHDGLGLNDMITITADPRDSDAGGASHRYRVRMDISGTAEAIDSGCTGKASKIVADIQFQHGPRGLVDSEFGVTHEALLTILIDRMEAFQAGPFACRENQLALEALLTAEAHLSRRAIARHAQNALGKNVKHSS